MTAEAGFNHANGGYVSNEIIALQIKHLEAAVVTMNTTLSAELRMLRSDAVRRDVYDAERRVDQAELAQVKEQLKEAAQRKWAVWIALAGVIFALGKDALTSVIGG